MVTLEENPIGAFFQTQIIEGWVKNDILIRVYCWSAGNLFLMSKYDVRGCEMNLNRSFYKAIQECLVSKMHSNEDFKINVTGDSVVTVEIRYLYDDTCYFILKIGGTSTSYSRCPGPITRNDYGELSKNEDVFSRIQGWLDNIESEIKAAPVLREINQHRSDVDKKLSDLEEQFNENDQEKFTQEEMLEFKTKLEEFRAEFTKKLEEEIKNKTELQSELRKITNEVDFLKLQIDSLSKGNWAKALLVRAVNWRKRNPEVMGSLASITRELLPEGVKEYIPEEVVKIIAGSGSPDENKN